MRKKRNKKLIIGVVSCSSVELKVPAPAYLLYSASPRFSLFYQHAVRNCAKVFILSAKYGFISPDDIIEPYDQKIVEGDSFPIIPEVEEAKKILFYGSGLYLSILSQASPPIQEMTRGGLFEAAKGIGRQGRLKAQDWPMSFILEGVYKGEITTLLGLRQLLVARKYQQPTIEAQEYRVRHCPLLRVVNGGIKFSPESQINKKGLFI